jgi:hypothetical protein
MRNLKLDRRSGVMVIGRQAPDMVAKAAMAIDKLLTDPALTADMVVILILPLLRPPSVLS